MAKKYSIWYQKVILARQKARNKARKQGYQTHLLKKSFPPPEMQAAYEGWRAGDPEATKLYFTLLAKRGPGNRTKGAVKAKSGRKGGLKTKLVKRKPYVKGQQHGNYGKRYAKPKQVQLTDEQALKRLIQEVEYRIKNPDAHTALTWDPSAWKPPKIPKDTPVIDARGSTMQPGVPRSGEGEDTTRD